MKDKDTEVPKKVIDRMKLETVFMPGLKVMCIKPLGTKNLRFKKTYTIKSIKTPDAYTFLITIKETGETYNHTRFTPKSEFKAKVNVKKN